MMHRKRLVARIGASAALAPGPLAILLNVCWAETSTIPVTPPRGPFAPPRRAPIPSKPIATAPSLAAGSPWFSLMGEITGDAGASARRAITEGLFGGVTFHTVLTASEQKFLSANPNAAFAYFAIPPEANASACYPASTDPNADAILKEYAAQRQQVWRFPMSEFDQSGGCWSNGRPNPAGLSDAQAYSAWKGYYLNTLKLGNYLNKTAQERGYKWMVTADYGFSTQYAYDMGSDIVLLERNIDAVSGITPGLAMLRGAANQHGKKDWGIDISTWRYWNDGPTEYANGRVTTGWSTNTFKRNMFIAYMGGANIIHMEAAEYHKGASSGNALNPLGLTVQQFYDFATKRHPNRGTPYAPIAIMQDHYSGLEPKFGEWNQADYKWYWKNTYSAGDTMFANLLGLIYPNYNLWGTLPSGAPKVLRADRSIDVSATTSAYRQALATGADPRRWEPMGNSRWGETFDIITNQAPLETFLKYKVIVLATGGPVGDAMLTNFSSYVEKGGILVLNALQLSTQAQTLAGVSLTQDKATATSEMWTQDGTLINENPYTYTVVRPTTATVVSDTTGNPIITQNKQGSGVVYLTTPDLLQDKKSSSILNVGQKLLQTLQERFAIAAVNGPQAEFLVNTDGSKIIVTLINTDISGAVWNGKIAFRRPSTSYSASEWTEDKQVSTAANGDRVVIDATVPPYDVRVYALEVH